MNSHNNKSFLTTMKFTRSFLTLAVTTSKSFLMTKVCFRQGLNGMTDTFLPFDALFTGSAAAQMGLFERSLDSHIRTICGIDIISPTPPPTTSPSSVPSAAPSISTAPTILVKACDNNIGQGQCLDGKGEPFDYCTLNLGEVTPETCQSIAEASEKSVGWQFVGFKFVPGVCTIYFSEDDSGDDVRPLCPENFAGFSIRSGTGFPVSTGSGVGACFACNKN